MWLILLLLLLLFLNLTDLVYTWWVLLVKGGIYQDNPFMGFICRRVGGFLGPLIGKLFVFMGIWIVLCGPVPVVALAILCLLYSAVVIREFFYFKRG